MNPIAPPPTRAPFTDDDGRPFAWHVWISQLEHAFNLLLGTGTTAQRPALASFVGFMYFDTTLGKPIWAKTITTSTAWVDATGAAA